MIKILCFIGTILFSYQAIAFSIIRDTETENFLLSYVKRAAKAAGLPEENSSVVLINNDDINAFVTSGQTIFIHSGLITHAQSPDDIMFVISHETGHIKGGHALRGQLMYQKAQKNALISTVLGGLLAVASGEPEAGIAIMMGSQSSALNTFTHYRQIEESTADRTAFDIMQKTNYSMLGFKNIMNQIQLQERLNPYINNNYFRTHPLTSDRIQDLNRFLISPLPITQDEKFSRVKAKIIAFLYPPEQTFELFKGKKTSDLYAQAIAEYKNNKFEVAFEKINQLIDIEPENPYFYELKGQFFFETGNIDESITYYDKANQLLPSAPLLQIEFARVLIESSEQKNAQRAIELLKKALQKEPELSEAWKLSSIAYTILNKKNLSSYAMAEYYYAIGNSEKAKKLSQKILPYFPKDSAEAIKLNDILKTQTKS